MNYKDLTRRVNIRLNERDYMKLSNIAYDRKISLSKLIRYILEEYIRRFS